MILADALCYAEEFEPSTIIDVATLTGKLHYIIHYIQIAK